MKSLYQAYSNALYDAQVARYKFARENRTAIIAGFILIPVIAFMAPPLFLIPILSILLVPLVGLGLVFTGSFFKYLFSRNDEDNSPLQLSRTRGASVRSNNTSGAFTTTLRANPPVGSNDDLASSYDNNDEDNSPLQLTGSGTGRASGAGAGYDSNDEDNSPSRTGGASVHSLMSPEAIARSRLGLRVAELIIQPGTYNNPTLLFPTERSALDAEERSTNTSGTSTSRASSPVGSLVGSNNDLTSDDDSNNDEGNFACVIS